MLNPLKKNNSKKYFFVGILISFLFNTAPAQDRQFSIDASANTTDANYWWSNKNSFGRESSNFDLQTSWRFKDSKRVYLVDISLNSENKFYINESFIKYNLSEETFLRFGKYYRDFSAYLNDEISSGSMLVSHNAEPMPKIGLFTSRNIKKNQHINFEFGIAHGIFDKNDFYTNRPFLHEKFIYINVVKPSYEFGVGFVHEAMWGGSTVLLGDQPQTIKDFFKVFISADGPLKEGQPHANALGNHLGIWDFYYKKNINDYTIKLYYQHFFEDTSGLRFANKWDGLWGLELINYIPKTNILFEYLDTTNQFINPPYVAESYYNPGEYPGGWSYKNYTIGNPFMSHSNQEETAMIHLGLSGTISSNYYKIYISKRINISDSIKYKVMLSKKINPKSKVNFFIVNNESNNGGFGVSISKML
jgi:hypothetical protein